MQAIKPSEVPGNVRKRIPNEVFSIFNEMIIENWNQKGFAIVDQKKAAERIAAAIGIETQAVFDMKMLDIEQYFEEAGWKVDYMKSPYYDDTPSTFKFSERK